MQPRKNLQKGGYQARVVKQNTNRERVPEQVLAVSDMLNHNASIRRYTSFGILNYLTQKGLIPAEKDGVKVSKYVDFGQDKFSITINGLKTEYRYSETFFLNAFAGAFITLSARAQGIIDVFVSSELGCKTSDVLVEEEVKSASNSALEKESNL